MCFIANFLKLALTLGVLVLVVQYLRYWMESKQYVFNKEDVAKLAKQYAGKYWHVKLHIFVILARRSSASPPYSITVA